MHIDYVKSVDDDKQLETLAEYTTVVAKRLLVCNIQVIKKIKASYGHNYYSQCQLSTSNVSSMCPKTNLYKKFCLVYVYAN